MALTIMVSNRYGAKDYRIYQTHQSSSALPSATSFAVISMLLTAIFGKRLCQLFSEIPVIQPQPRCCYGLPPCISCLMPGRSICGDFARYARYHSTDVYHLVLLLGGGDSARYLLVRHTDMGKKGFGSRLVAALGLTRHYCVGRVYLSAKQFKNAILAIK